MSVDDLLAAAGEAWGTDWAVVVASARRAVELDPWRADIRAALGLALNATGASTEAKRQLELALDLDPDHPRYWADLALVSVGEGDHRMARSLLEESIVRRPDYVWATVELTRCYGRLGEHIAMAAAAARAINLDPIGEPTQVVAAILTAYLPRRPVPTGGRGWFRWRRRMPDEPRQPVGVDGFLAARELPPHEAVPQLERILASLDDGGADHCVVLETLANLHFTLGRHDHCAQYSSRAVRGLPCVRALVAEPRGGRLIEAGRDHDAKAAYGELIRELFDEEPGLTAFEFESGRTNDVRRVTVWTGAGMFTIQRGGNLFVIDPPDGDRVVYEAFDRNDLPLAEW